MRIFIVLLYVVYVSYCNCTEYKVQQNDRILFVGHTNAFVGATSEHGFINIFKNETNKSFKNVTVQSGGRFSDNLHLLSRLSNNLLSYFSPTKVVIALGIDYFVDSLSQTKYEIESIVAKVLEYNIPTILLPIAINGESIELNDYSEILEEYAEINKQISRDYNIMYVNLFNPITKHIERVNIDNMPHSVLTYDGQLLNERGHMLVALNLLRAFGIEQHSFSSDNLVSRAEKSASELKQELLRLEEFFQ